MIGQQTPGPSVDRGHGPELQVQQVLVEARRPAHGLGRVLIRMSKRSERLIEEAREQFDARAMA